MEIRVVKLEEADSRPHNVEPGRYAKISVTDTGIGMDEDTMKRIFDPFFTTKPKGRGTGLGLASAYGIIKNHDGFIVVNSDLGQGTTFTLALPFSEQEAYREADIEKQLLKGSETVLIVDDEDMIREVGQAMLEKLGYHVLVADSGLHAFDVINENEVPIDIVILDLITPDLDGNKTFDIIREIRPTMPIILASGYAIDGQANDIMNKGCNGFIQKPYNMYTLSQKIREILD